MTTNQIDLYPIPSHSQREVWTLFFHSISIVINGFILIDPVATQTWTDIQINWSRPYSEMITKYAELATLAHEHERDV